MRSTRSEIQSAHNACSRFSFVWDSRLVQVNKHLSTMYKGFLYSMAVIFSVITVVTSVTALRYITVDSINYSVFADN